MAESPKTGSFALVRILDANANRAAEGLRVVEEYLRFVLEDKHLTSLYKQLRHGLAELVQRIPASDRYSARDTQSDVGTTITSADEYLRGTAEDVAEASHKRVEQALRCLEEYAKPLYPQLAPHFERLRYDLYTLARAVALTRFSRERLLAAKLYVLVDAGSDEREFAQRAETLVTAGVHILQLREKNLPDRELLTRARRLRQITRGTSTLFVMNDRPDLTVLADADGVHVGQSELSVKDARAIVGPDRLVGVSTHSIEQARQAVLDGANYIGCGPTFPSGTKYFDDFPGLDFLRHVAAEISLPAFAIGGITLKALDEVLATGMRRVAISGGVTRAADPAGEVGRLLARLA